MLFTPVFGLPLELFELHEPLADELLEPAALELVELLEAAELAELSALELPELSELLSESAEELSELSELSVSDEES